MAREDSKFLMQLVIPAVAIKHTLTPLDHAAGSLRLLHPAGIKHLRQGFESNLKPALDVVDVFIIPVGGLGMLWIGVYQSRFCTEKFLVGVSKKNPYPANTACCPLKLWQ